MNSRNQLDLNHLNSESIDDNIFFHCNESIWTEDNIECMDWILQKTIKLLLNRQSKRFPLERDLSQRSGAQREALLRKDTSPVHEPWTPKKYAICATYEFFYDCKIKCKSDTDKDNLSIFGSIATTLIFNWHKMCFCVSSCWTKG